MKIGIIDEKSANATRYQKAIEEANKEAHEVETIPFDSLVSDFKSLQDCNFRHRSECPGLTSGIEKYDILIMDIDLRYLAKDVGMVFSGEQVAYLARLLLDTKLIVGVNQREARQFKLELMGDMSSNCDLRIDPEELGNKGLWGDQWNDYRPWHWPILPRFAASFDERVDFVLNHLDSPILESLGLEKTIDKLDPNLLKYLGKDSKKTSFKSYISKAPNGLTQSDIDTLTGNIVATHEMKRRAGGFVAFKIAKWLNQCVLPCQSALVDAPHMVDLFPSLFTGKVEDYHEWSLLSNLDNPQNIDKGRVFEYEFAYPCWMSRKSWIVPRKLAEDLRKESFGRKRPFRFCEDTSRFHPESECTIYDTELPSTNHIRCVKVVEEGGREYVPEDWLLR